jgi:hypothetical protein
MHTTTSGPNYKILFLLGRRAAVAAADQGTVTTDLHTSQGQSLEATVVAICRGKRGQYYIIMLYLVMRLLVKA